MRLSNFKNSFLLILTIFLFWGSSCSENPTSPNILKTYLFPMKIGNYWIYNFYLTDSANNEIPNSRKIDSLVVIDSLNYYNKSAFKLIYFRDVIPIDTIYISSHSDSLFLFYKQKDSIFSSYLDNWQKIFDLSLENWNISYNIINKLVKPDSAIFEIVDTLHFVNTGRLISKSSFKIDSITKQLYMFEKFNDSQYYYNMYCIDSITPKDTFYSKYKFKRTESIIEKFQFVEDIGLMKYSIEPHFSQTGMTPLPPWFTPAKKYYGGFVRELLRYKLK